LRKEYFLAGKKPSLWTLAVELDQPELPAAWIDEESMLGDFLRNLRELSSLQANEVRLDEQIPEHHRAILGSLGQWTDDEFRELLSEAGLTGAQLLGAGEREA